MLELIRNVGSKTLSVHSSDHVAVACDLADPGHGISADSYAIYSPLLSAAPCKLAAPVLHLNLVSDVTHLSASPFVIAWGDMRIIPFAFPTPLDWQCAMTPGVDFGVQIVPRAFGLSVQKHPLAQTHF